MGHITVTVCVLVFHKQAQGCCQVLVCQRLSVLLHGENVTVDMLCNGNPDCSGGDDDISPLCESELCIHSNS